LNYLPDEERQGWLLGRLAELIERLGPAQLVASPILLPTDEFFPDEWTPDGAGVWRLARRLMRYAGLEELEAVIRVADATEIESDHAAALFHGIVDGECLYTVRVENLDDPMGLAAALSHEVAHAFRHHHGLVVDDEAEEEQLTDVTTVFLGFGVLTLNASYRYRAAGELIGTMTVTTWSHSSMGYLPPEELAFLLAVHAAVRELAGSAVREIKSALETNQAAYFLSDLRKLGDRREEIVRRLRVPDRRLWPPAPGMEQLTGPIAGEPRVEGDASEEYFTDEPPERMQAVGKPVFRVRKDRKAVGAFGGAVLGGLVSLALGAAFPGAGMGFYLLVFVTLIAVGLAVGVGFKYYVCSNMDCEHRLGAEDERCGFCGGTVSGTIAHASERLAAEEELREKRRRKLPG